MHGPLYCTRKNSGVGHGLEYVGYGEAVRPRTAIGGEVHFVDLSEGGQPIVDVTLDTLPFGKEVRCWRVFACTTKTVHITGQTVRQRYSMHQLLVSWRAVRALHALPTRPQKAFGVAEVMLTLVNRDSLNPNHKVVDRITKSSDVTFERRNLLFARPNGP